jgi:polyhydroxybutyrate depolymerase
MSMTRFSSGFLFAVLLLASMPSRADEPDCVSVRGRSSYKVESRCMSLQQGGVTRTYRLYVPKSLNAAGQIDKQPSPLLLVLHGGGGSGGAMEGLALGQFNRIADRHGVIVAYPDGIGRGWNDGRSDLKAKAVKENVDDVGFLRALVAHIGTLYPVDHKRIYATGISNGGLMSFRLACDAPDMVAAVAPVAANLSVELAANCRPSRMPALAIINGTADPLVPWTGGDIKVLWTRRGKVLSAPETFERWVRMGQCAPASTEPPREPQGADGTSVIRHIARECRDGSEVRLYEITGGGHTWPSGQPYLGEGMVGKVSHALNASEEIWSFVSRFSLP